MLLGRPGRHGERRGERHHHRQTGRGVPQGTEVLVFPAVEHLHLPRRPPDRADMEGVRVPLLPEGGGVRAQRPQAEGAEGGQAGEAGVRGHVHDGGQGLGGRTHLRADHHRSNLGERPCTYSKARGFLLFPRECNERLAAYFRK